MWGNLVKGSIERGKKAKIREPKKWSTYYKLIWTTEHENTVFLNFNSTIVYPGKSLKQSFRDASQQKQ